MLKIFWSLSENLRAWCELYSLSWTCFRSCGVGTLCTENCISFYMCSAVEVAWSAQNIRHSSRDGYRQRGAPWPS